MGQAVVLAVAAALIVVVLVWMAVRGYVRKGRPKFPENSVAAVPEVSFSGSVFRQRRDTDFSPECS